MSKFYGDKRVEDVEEYDNHVILRTKDETIRISKKMYDISMTRKPTDLTALWDKQLAPITMETLALWLSWDIKLDQLDYLFNLLKSSIEHNLESANNNLWGKKTTERTMSDLDKVLQPTNGNGKSK